jgi:DNA uptake protein ComE-like DNA-binding protein
MKALESVKGFFTFSRKELRGIAVLSGLILIFILLRITLPWVIRDETKDYSRFDEDMKRFLTALSDSVNQGDMQPVGLNDTVPRHTASSMPQPVMILELNGADSVALEALPGIGPVLSSRILKYRHMLGGFTSAGQLLEVYGMDTIRFRRLLPLVSVDTSPVKKLDLNTVTFKELLNHPYLEYEQVKEIFRFRDKNNGFRSLEELLPLETIDSALYVRIVPYLFIEQ